jgi:hypothetical protein
LPNWQQDASGAAKVDPAEAVPKGGRLLRTRLRVANNP